MMSGQKWAGEVIMILFLQKYTMMEQILIITLIM